jgi:methylenetetrahydrofolate reductase (NADPH)
VAAYPEKHPEAASIEADIDNLKRKLDAGGACAITQFFFDNEDFLRFRDKCVAAGIDAPIHPGILPVENFEKMLNFAGRCQARVPEWMHKAFARAETPEERYLLSVSIACDQMDGLMGEGVEHLHVYTLNNPDLTFDVCRVLGYAAAPLAAAGEAGAA